MHVVHRGVHHVHINRNMNRQLIQRGVQAHKPKSREPDLDRLQSAAVTTHACPRCRKPVDEGHGHGVVIEARRMTAGIGEIIERVELRSLHAACAGNAGDSEAKRLEQKYRRRLRVQVQVIVE